jgi:phenylacetate-coenzyme A ligase PaaK-like adenylate-forming protein
VVTPPGETLPSRIHLPESEWATALRDAALVETEPVDRSELLGIYRDHSAFYRQRLDGIAAWSDIPLLEKDDVAKVPVFDDGTIKEARTSGTMGQQVSIWNTSREREFRRALLYRPQLFYPLPEQVRQLVFVDGDWCMAAGDQPKRFTYGGIEYRTWFAGAAGAIEQIHALLVELRPQLIRGISSAIVRQLMESERTYRQLGVAIVAPGGEYLLPEWRSLIEEGFGAPVYDRYGSQETGAIAWQCPDCGEYHANVDEILLEPGADGLVATPLFVSSQPLLRYRLGDHVQVQAASGTCRVRLPVLTIAAARRDDWLVDGHGRLVSPLSFQFERFEGLTAWRLHQASDGRLTLYFDASRPAVTGPVLAQALRRLVPDREVRLAEGVWQLKRGGKFKRIISDFRQA